MTPAIRYGRALDREMRKQGRTTAWLAEHAMVSPAAVANWRAGGALPWYQSGLWVADALLSDRLARLITELRTRTCRRCARDFIVAKQHDAKYCSGRCRGQANQADHNARRGILHRERLGSLLAIWQDVGERMCRQWCPNSGMCPDETCPIQMADLCPLPLREVPATTTP